jgi:tetratricopeptide (TPR) repeat protein
MTPEELEALWQLGQQQEAERSLDAARDTYKEILAGSPRQVMVQVRLSEVEQRAGRYRAARDAAMQAAHTIAQTRRWEGLGFVTANLLVFDERKFVIDLIRQAPWDDPRVVTQSPVLSQQLWLCGDEEGSLRMLDIAERRVVADHRLAYSRGAALQQLGRLEQATAAFEDSIRISPDFPVAHWSLAYHMPSDPPGARVERIRGALRHQDGQMERAMLHYALFKELDDAGQLDAAWPELEAGAAIMRGLHPYSALAFKADVEAMLAGAEATAGRSAKDGGTRTPIFIVGMPRSGTTVLSRIITAHPSVADAGELNALEHAIGEGLDRFVELPLPADAMAALRGMDLAPVADAYRRRTAGYYRGTATHLVDKNPMNVFAAGIIAAAMPDAKILCMSRGAMDACFSNLTQLFHNGAFAYSYDQRQLAERYAVFRRVVEHWKATLPANFLEVAYESLVEDPVATGREVMAFCGLAFDPSYADITRNTSPSATASKTQIREPIHAQGLGRWRRYEDRLQPLASRLRELDIPL